MARFWITPDEDKAAQAGNVCSSAGLEEYDRIPSESIHGATYRKRRLSNQNLVSQPDGAFAASTGTLIYDGAVGKEALLSVFEDFTGDVTEIQEKALGHYSLLISTGDRLYVFCDPEQSYDVYYSSTSTDGYVVGSHLSVLGACLEDLTVDAFSLYERILQKSDINGTTLYEETEKLLGHEHLVIELDSAEVTLQEHSLPPTPLDLSQLPIEEAVATYARHVSDIFQSITEAFPESVGLQLTGGLDSRTILAALLSIEHHPRTFTGVADDQITTADPRDMEVVNLLADRFDLETNRLDWDADHLETPDSWGEYFDRYGFYYSKFGAMPQFFDDWEKRIKDHPELMMKGLSPVFPHSKPQEKEFNKEYLSIEEFEKNTFMRSYSLRVILNLNLNTSTI